MSTINGLTGGWMKCDKTLASSNFKEILLKLVINN